MPHPKPVVLCILDGWGLNPDTSANAPYLADTPTFDRLMATCTAMTNVAGNVVATFVISKWEHVFDQAKFEAYIANGGPPAEPAADETAAPVAPAPASAS